MEDFEVIHRGRDRDEESEEEYITLKNKYEALKNKYNEIIWSIKDILENNNPL